MPRFDLEVRERDLAQRIAQKERDIGYDLEVLRQAARQVSTRSVQVFAGAAILVGAFVAWRAYRAFRRPRYVMAW